MESGVSPEGERTFTLIVPGRDRHGEHPCELCKESALAKTQTRSDQQPLTPSGDQTKVGKHDAGKGVLTDGGFRPRLTAAVATWFPPAP